MPVLKYSCSFFGKKESFKNLDACFNSPELTSLQRLGISVRPCHVEVVLHNMKKGELVWSEKTRINTIAGPDNGQRFEVITSHHDLSRRNGEYFSVGVDEQVTSVNTYENALQEIDAKITTAETLLKTSHLSNHQALCLEITPHTIDELARKNIRMVYGF